MGLYEEIGDTWRMMRDFLGVSNAHFASNINRAGKKDRESTNKSPVSAATKVARLGFDIPSLSERVRALEAKIRELQWADILLYERGRRVFDKVELSFA